MVCDHAVQDMLLWNRTTGRGKVRSPMGEEFSVRVWNRYQHSWLIIALITALKNLLLLGRRTHILSKLTRRSLTSVCGKMEAWTTVCWQFLVLSGLLRSKLYIQSVSEIVLPTLAVDCSVQKKKTICYDRWTGGENHFHGLPIRPSVLCILIWGVT